MITRVAIQTPISTNLSKNLYRRRNVCESVSPSAHSEAGSEENFCKKACGEYYRFRDEPIALDSFLKVTKIRIYLKNAILNRKSSCLHITPEHCFYFRV
ncbi:hypothetical protein J6590_036991 [Homalodisca vitripennis]|nr:hypothetical protein J6590_036991 [Homalodisca vitripennis]